MGIVSGLCLDCVWAAWTELAACLTDPEAIASLDLPAHWMSAFFRAHAEFITRCERCVNELDANKLKRDKRTAKVGMLAAKADSAMINISTTTTKSNCMELPKRINTTIQNTLHQHHTKNLISYNTSKIEHA